MPPLLASPETIEREVGRIGSALSSRYDDGVVVVAVLKGSLMFAADLVRSMSISPVVDFLALSTYAPGSGRVRLVKDLDLDITGLDVVLVEDIVDTGLTLAFLRNELECRGPNSVSVCTLVDRPARRIVPAVLDFVAFEVPDVFVLGYGLDYAGRYRNLRGLFAGEPAELEADPDVYVADLYPGAGDKLHP